MFFQLKERFYASASPLLYDTANDKSKSGLDLKAKTIASVHALLLPLPDALKQAIYALPLAGYGISARPPRLTRKVRVGADKDSVIRTNSLTNIGIPCAVGMVYSHQMPWEERKVKLEEFFTKLFGQKYKIYDAFAKNDTFFEMADEVDVTLSYDDLIRNMRMLGIDVPDVSKDRVKWMKRFSFRLTMTFRSRQFLREGVIPDFNIREYQSILDLNIDVMTSYPMADALAMLSCEDTPPNFSLYDFLGHIQPIEAFGWNIKELNGIKVGGGRGLSEARYGKSMAVRQTMAAFTDLANTVGNVKPRTNEDGYAILVNGSIIKTNFEPQFEDFKIAVKNLYDQETKEFKSDSESTAPLADKVLAVDWQGNALVYTNSYGRYEFKDLKGSMPLTLHTIADLLDTTPGTYIVNTMTQAIKSATGSTPSVLWSTFSPKELMNPERTSDELEGDFSLRQRDAALIRSLGEKWNEMQVTISRRMEFSFYIDLYNKYAVPLYAEKAYAARKEEIQEYSKAVPFQKELTLSGVNGLTHVMPHQFRILSDMTQRAPKNALLGVDPGGGKCVRGHTEIPTSHGIMPINRLFNRAKGKTNERSIDGQVRAFDDTANMSGVYRTSGVTTVVNLASGKRIEGLPEHKLWVQDSGKGVWKALGELSAGAFLPRSTANIWPAKAYKFKPSNSMPSVMSNDLAQWLGLLIAEGNTQEGYAAFCNSDPNLLDRFETLTKELFGLKVVRKVSSKNGNVVTYNLLACSRELVRWLDANGISGQRSGSLTVPECVRCSTKAHQAAFVSALWDGDGSFYQTMKHNTLTWVNEYTSASPEIIRYMSAFLDNADIEHRVHWRDHAVRDNVWGDKNSYARLYLDRRDHDEIRRLFSLDHSEKAEALKTWLDSAEKSGASFGVYDRVPGAGYIAHAVSRMKEFGISQLSLCNANGLHHRAVSGRRNLTYSNAHLACSALEKCRIFGKDKEFTDAVKTLKSVISKRYDRVVSVYKGIKRTVYDICVPGPHAYSMSGIMSHNTAMYISDMAGLMSNRIIKRPAVVCPKGLRPNVIREILGFGKGDIRYFVIDTARWDRFTMGQDAPFQEAPFEAFKKLILSQPANTVFLIDYGFLKLRSKQIKVGNVSMYTYPFAVWLSQVFEYFVADESHKVKNIGSQLSEAFKTFTPYATYKRMASGTVIHNKASDLTGQIATFGPDILAPFAAELEGGTPTPAEVKEILGAMHKRVKHYNAETREWSFLLPKIRETIHTVPMTDKQFEFYTKAFNDITVELMANAEFAKSVNDPSAEDKIVEALRAALSPLEVFINAPGGNSKLAQGFRNTGVSKNDLVSTKVAYIDGIIDRHVKSGDTGKVIVMSYNKEVSKHFFETSKFKERALHYTAAAQKLEDLTEEFRSNDNLLVMFADETTLREGFNLQYASRIIRVQTVWTPGDFLQALARVVRPEVPDANGKLVYDRKYINFDWIVFEPSIEVAKMARLYSKIIRKALVDRLETDRKFAQWADGQMVEGHKDATGELVSYKDVPELIIKANTFTMNLASIQAMQTRDNLTDHVKAYSSYMLWMDNEFDAHKESLRRQAAEERGVDPASITDTALRMMAMRKVTHTPYEGEGLAAKYGNGYMPFLSNATPTIDLGLNLVPVTSVADHESDSDEDEDEFSEEAEADNTTVDLNDTVVTEYGIGNVTRVNRLTVRVALEGLGKITIPKTEVLAPVTEADKNALAKIFAKMRKAGATPTLLTADKRGNPATHIIDFNKATTAAPPTVSPTEAIARVREAVSISAPKPVPVPTGLNLRNSPATLPTITNVKTAKTVSIKPPVANKPEEPKVAPVKPPVLPTVIKTEAPAKVVKPPVADAPKSPDVSLELSAVWIYGQPAIISTAKTAKGTDDKLAADKLRELGFGRVPTMLMAQVRTWQGLQGILKYFDQEGYYIPDDYRQELLTAMKAMKVARDKMDKVVYDAKVARTFIIDNTRKVKDQAVEIHPFIMINEDEAYLMINAAISTAARPLMAKKPVAGVDRFERMDPYFIRFFKSKKMLIDNAMTWDDDTGVSIRNLKKFAASIKALN